MSRRLYVPDRGNIRKAVKKGAAPLDVVEETLSNLQALL